MSDPDYQPHQPPAPNAPMAAPDGPLQPPPPGQVGGYEGRNYRLPKRRTGMWMFLGLLVGFFALMLFVFSIFAPVLGGFSSPKEEPFGVSEFPREDGDGTSKIAVIPVNGVIMEGSSGGLFGGGGPDPVALIRDGLDRAASDEDVAAVIIEVNSPGGGVTASDIIYHEIKTFREDSGKPVVIYMKDLAASGGYYISCAGDLIVANRTTLTGSIGVIIQGYNLHGTLTELLKGQDATVKAGGNKTMGGMFMDPNSDDYAEGRRLLQEIVDESHAGFKGVVKEGRGNELADDWETYADGRIFTAKTALEKGFIDEIGYFEEAVKHASELANVNDPQVVEYGRRVSLASLLGLSSEELEREAALAKDAAPVMEQRIMASQVQEILRIYPGRPMAIWVP